MKQQQTPGLPFNRRCEQLLLNQEKLANSSIQHLREHQSGSAAVDRCSYNTELDGILLVSTRLLLANVILPSIMQAVCTLLVSKPGITHQESMDALTRISINQSHSHIYNDESFEDDSYVTIKCLGCFKSQSRDHVVAAQAARVSVTHSLYLQKSLGTLFRVGR